MSQAQSPHDINALRHPKHALSWLGVGALRLLGLLPYPVIYALSAVLGQLSYYLHSSRRHVTLTNLRLCFPEWSERKCRRVAQRHFRILLCSVLSIGVVWWGSKSRLKRVIKVRGMEHLDAAIEQHKQSGQGIILLAPHFVTLDAGGMILSKDQPVLSMYQRNRNDVFDHVTFVRRTRFNAVIYDRKAPLTSLIRLIRNGRPFYYLPDQNAGASHGIFVPFFGIPASTFPALGKIAQAGKAVVIPVFSRTLTWGRGIETIIKPPLTDYPSGDQYADTLRMNQVVEAGARELEENYLWSHKRFKRRPDGEASLY